MMMIKATPLCDDSCAAFVVSPLVWPSETEVLILTSSVDACVTEGAPAPGSISCRASVSFVTLVALSLTAAAVGKS